MLKKKHIVIMESQASVATSLREQYESLFVSFLQSILDINCVLTF